MFTTAFTVAAIQATLLAVADAKSFSMPVHAQNLGRAVIEMEKNLAAVDPAFSPTFPLAQDWNMYLNVNIYFGDSATSSDESKFLLDTRSEYLATLSASTACTDSSCGVGYFDLTTSLSPVTIEAPVYAGLAQTGQ